MAGTRMHPIGLLHRATWRWCLAGGAACFLLGVGLGSPSGGASIGNPSRATVARVHTHHEARRATTGRRWATTRAPAVTNGSTVFGVPAPHGFSDDTSVNTSSDAVRPPPTTQPSVHTHTVGDPSPAVQSVPSSTAPAVLLLVIGFGVFAAGRALRRRRALPRA